MRSRSAIFGVLVLLAASMTLVVGSGTAGAVDVTTAAEFEAAWETGTTTNITLLNDIQLAGTAPTRPLGASDITVEGNGFTLTAVPNDRVVDGFNPSGAGTWRNITVTGGNAGGGNSAGIFAGGPLTLENVVSTGNNASNLGGGAYSIGDMTVINSTITGNTTGGDGGGVYAQQGSVFLINSTVSGNDAGDDGGGVSADIAFTATNSTVTGNTAADAGGGVVAQDTTLIYTDIVGNTGGGDGANLFSNDSDVLTSFGSVIAAPQGGASCNNFLSTDSQGYNYEADGDSCGFGAGPGDVTDGADPQLGALADNGGPTQTLLPATGSPLLDKIPGAECGGPNGDITADQRGVARPQLELCDIGSVEVEAPVVPPPPPIVIEPTFTG